MLTNQPNTINILPENILCNVSAYLECIKDIKYIPNYNVRKKQEYIRSKLDLHEELRNELIYELSIIIKLGQRILRYRRPKIIYSYIIYIDQERTSDFYFDENNTKIYDIRWSPGWNSPLLFVILNGKAYLTLDDIRLKNL